MRIVALAFCLTIAAGSAAQDQGPAEVEPVINDEDTSDRQKTEGKTGKNADNEIQINLSVRDFKVLIDAIEGKQPKDQDAKNSNQFDCDDPALSYADFVSCEDLNAQKEMARGTTDIRNFTGTTVKISWVGLSLIFFSFLAACAAAIYGRRAANAAIRTAEAAERAEGAFVDIELSTNPRIFPGKSLTDNPKMTIEATIFNYGKTPARKLKYKITPVEKGNQPIHCEGVIGLFPPSKAGTDKILKDFASTGTKFSLADWLLNKGTDFTVEWEYETIFSSVTRTCKYTANFQTDVEGTVDYTVNTTHQDYAPRFDRIDESESVRLKEGR